MKMKKKLLFALAILFVSFASAQYTLIPDTNFEQALINQSIDSEGILDGRVLSTDLVGVTNLNISNSGISNLTGLEAFISLQFLDVSDNNLNSLELQNSSLREIKANNCNLAGKTIRFQNNPPNGQFLTNVTHLELENNSIGAVGSTINFGGVPNITNLSISGNNFGILNLTNNTKIETLAAVNCPNLTTLTNLSLLTQLTSLNVARSAVNSLNLSNLTELQLLDIEETQIATLDLSTNRNLARLIGINGVLTEVNLKSGFNTLITRLQLNGNPNLNCIEVDNVAFANQQVAQTNWVKDNNTTFATNCNPTTAVIEVGITSGQPQDENDNYIVTAANPPITLSFNAQDQNGMELSAAQLANYGVRVSTLPSTTQNPATGGNINTPGVDFELFTNELQTITVNGNGIDGTKDIRLRGDGLFEADEFFSIQITSNDPNISIKNNVAGTLTLPVRIIDNEITNINLSIVNNGIEGSQDVTLRLTSSLANNTGAPMPFAISVLDGTATEGVDFELTNSQVLLPNGASSVDFTIRVIADAIPNEGIENFSVTIAYAGNINPPSRLNLQTASVTPTITDAPANPVFTVAAAISGAGNFPYTVEEGQEFTLSFNALQATSVEGLDFDVPFTISGSAIIDTDFSFPASPTSFTVNSTNPVDGSLKFSTLVTPTPNENKEIIIALLKDPKNEFVWEGADENGNLVFKVEINDKVPFLARASLSGINNVGTIANPIYEITEGQEFNLTLRSLTAGISESSVLLALSTDGSTATLNTDFSFEPNPSWVTISNETESNIRFTIASDVVPNENESIRITLSKDPENRFNWENANPDGSITFVVQIKDGDPDSTNIFAEFDNTGGIEGGTDTFTLKLKNSDGSPWLNTTGQPINFPITFKNEILFSSESNFVSEAEEGDYQLANGLPILDAIISIQTNESEGSLILNLIPDTDTEREYYTATVENPNSNLQLTFLPKTVQAVIIDSEGPFLVTAIPKENGDLKLIVGDPEFDPDCCSGYTIEEGKELVIRFKAEKGIPLNTEYDFKVTYSGDAKFPEDFSKIDPDDVLNGTVKVNDIYDNQFILSIKIDDLFNELSISGSEIREYGEELQLYFEPLSDKYAISTVNKLSGSNDVFRIFLVDVLPASITPTPGKTIASENPLVNAEFTIRLNTPNNTGSPLRTSYEVAPNSTATSGEDFEVLTGYVDIAVGEQTAAIVIQPINDNLVEPNETVVLQLINGPGYSIQGSGVASIIIESDDIALIAATVITTDNTASEADQTDTGKFTFSLSGPATEDITINFRILSNEPLDATANDFELLDAAGNVLGSNTVVIKSGTTSTDILVRAINDDLDENNEQVRVQLTPGAGYNIGTPNTATVQIISRTFNTETFDPRTVTVLAKSAICADKDEGSIVIENASGFRFNVVLEKENSTFKRQEVVGGSTNFEFQDLGAGTYKITLSNLDNPNLTAPGFTLNIAAYSAVTATINGINLTAKTGEMQLSGSNTYTLTNGNNAYFFEFENTQPKTVEIPLEQGLNTITIAGDAVCQGILKKNLFLEQYSAYPNPTRNLVNITGLPVNEQLTLHLADIQGRTVFQKNTFSHDGMLTIDLTNFEAGLYMGLLTLKNGNPILLKFLKN